MVDMDSHKLFCLRANIKPTRGHGFKLVQEQFETQRRRSFFCQRVVNVWNSLPVSIANFSSFNSFKRSLQNVNLSSIFTRVWTGGICFSLLLYFLVFTLFFLDRHHVRGYWHVVTCSLQITVPALYIAMLSANKWNEKNSATTDPCCHGNKIWHKIGYNSDYNPRSFCLIGVLGVEILNDINPDIIMKDRKNSDNKTANITVNYV